MRTVFLHDPIEAHKSSARLKAQGVQLKVAQTRHSNAFFTKTKEIFTKLNFTVINIAGRHNIGKTLSSGAIEAEYSGGFPLNALVFEDPDTKKTIIVSPSPVSLRFDNSSPFPQIEEGYDHLCSETFFFTMSKYFPVIFATCYDSFGGGLHCLTQEIREDWSLAPLHTIPANLESFPSYIVTCLQVDGLHNIIPFFQTKKGQDDSWDEADQLEVDISCSHHSSVRVPLSGLVYRIVGITQELFQDTMIANLNDDLGVTDLIQKRKVAFIDYHNMLPGIAQRRSFNKYSPSLLNTTAFNPTLEDFQRIQTLIAP